MPTLNWIGKKAVENHHRQVPFRLLKDVPELSVGDPGTGNLIVEGDNLLALKALLPYYAGQVKCIYIDPPYNTGNEKWIYNDNVNSSEMRDWLGKAVGDDAEDLTRHDKWLCMMCPRLALLRQFLSEDGVILISIGDDELANLLHIAQEIFGFKNQIGIFVWKSRAKPANVGSAKFKPQKVSEYIIAFAKNISKANYEAIYSGEIRKYPHSDQKGSYRLQTILKSNRGENVRETMRFEVAGFTPPQTQRWQGGKEFIQGLYDSGYIEFRKKIPFRKYYELEEPPEHDPFYTFIAPEVSGTAEIGKTELNHILTNMHGFDTVKPTRLLAWLLQAVTSKGDIVLDSFAGSGTTAHSMLQLNKKDMGGRRFILVEMDQSIARNITSERVKRVIAGYKDSSGDNIEGLGGGFRYCQLGEPLFDEKGNIRSTVKFQDLARHVFFTETGEPLPKGAKTTSPLIGIYNGTGVYLLYNGILKDKAPEGGNVLTAAILAHLPEHDGPKVIYGTACRIGQNRLNQENITFKQLPYKLKVDAL